MKEHDLQKQIVDALILAGFDVLETTAYRQKGSSGVAKGIPDLLVSHKVLQGTFLGVEVKPPGPIKWSSPEQKQLAEERRFYVAQSPSEAIDRAWSWLNLFTSWPFSDCEGDVAQAIRRARRTLEALK